MNGSRKRFRDRLRRRKSSGKPSENRFERQTQLVRADARGKAGRDRSGSRRERVRRYRGRLEELAAWSKASLLEMRRRARRGSRALRRRAAPHAARAGKRLAPVLGAAAAVLRPVAAAIHAVLAPIAPYVSRGLFFLLRGVGVLVAGLLDLTLRAWAWTSARVRAILTAIAGFASREVTAVRTFAVLAAAAAIALAASQFIDYRGVAVGGEQYEGEVQAIAPVPMVDVKTTGEAHAYALLPLAVIALLLVPLTLRGRWRLGGAIALIGGIGVIVALSIDAPKGLDVGRLGDAYEGTDARLLEGFWTELIASAVLIAAGLALSRAVRAAGERPTGGRDRPRHAVGAGESQSTTAPGSAFGSGAGA